MQTEPILLGEGALNWHRYERVSGTYSQVHLNRGQAQTDGDDYATFNDAPVGTGGTLVAEVVETRESRHIGDLFDGVGPSTPTVGERITLGAGVLERSDLTIWGDPKLTTPTIGLRAEQGAELPVLDTRALYRCHEQTVRLWWEPAE